MGPSASAVLERMLRSGELVGLRQIERFPAVLWQVRAEQLATAMRHGVSRRCPRWRA